MHWDHIESNWTEFKSHIKLHWEKISDDQLEAIAGKRDHLAGKIQVMYGINREEAEHQLADWQDKQVNIDGHLYQTKPLSSHSVSK